MAWDNTKIWEDNTLVTANDLNTYVKDNLAYLYDSLPVRAWMWHISSLVTAGNAIANAGTSGGYFGVYSSQAGAANGDSFTQSFMLKPGTYKLKILGKTSSDSGKVDWSIDGAPIVSGQDWYTASTQQNVIMVVNVEVTGEGQHVLRGTINGKNASSSGYGLYLTAMWIEPSSDL
jgi:hypothetical protein